MNLSSFTLSRYLRLTLLLLMLASQGIVNAHELGDSHSFEADTCTTCIIGHGLGTAVSVCHEAPQVQARHALVPVHATTHTPVSHTTCHLARAPPVSSRNTQNLN